MFATSIGPMSILVMLTSHQHRVVASEPEGVGYRRPQARAAVERPRSVSYIVKIALRIGLLIIDCRRGYSLPQGKHRYDKLDGAGRAHRVPQHRLRGADRNLICPVLEDTLDSLCLRGVVKLGRRPVRVDVIDICGRCLGVPQSAHYSMSLAFRVRKSNVGGVCG